MKKLGRSVSVLGASLIVGACIGQLWPHSVFVFAGIAILGMMIEGWNESARKP